MPTIHSRFSVPLCNTIVDLYECIIQNAPLENQPVMQTSLDQVLEPRTMMADAQLREVCQEVIQQDTFQEVMQHYTSTGQNLGCSF
ncbi:MAG: hypothetical protein Q4B28_08065 [bacterium]|nr:hypothetical protein [bacterium]